MRPTLAALVTRARADFKSRLGITGELLRRATADVLAVVWSGMTHLVHGHISWAALQLFADLSEEEFLIRQASMYGKTKIPATFAETDDDTLATGVDTTVIPINSELVRDDGVTYKTTAEATITGTTANLAVKADLAGAAGNFPALTGSLTFVTPIPDIDDAVAVIGADGIIGGADEETTEALRTRFLEHLREPPQGGNDQDYVAWAKTVTGVTRVWPVENENGLGTVAVRFVRDDDVSIFPDAGEVTAVQTAIDAERPITADVTVSAPVEDAIAFTISITPDTAAIRLAVEAELEDMMIRDAEPGDGVSLGTILLSQILVAVGIAAGVDDFDVTVPAADVVPALGDLATVGTITWV